jgi:uncharacterized protein (DUF362 family)
MISLVRWGETAIRDAVELCDGLEAMRSGDSVLIKPNLPLGGEIADHVPGMYTSRLVIEQLVKLLRDHGAGSIAIGEGTVVVPLLGSTTATAFAAAGYDQLQRRYGVDLVDFNAGRFVERSIGDHRFAVSVSAFDYDVLINVPCLKTHIQTRISLAMKNLKGLLDLESKKLFHREGLDELIAALNRVVQTDLVVVDGRLAMEYGPISDLVRKADLVLAGTDVFEADIVGSRLLGIAPQEIGFLRCYGRLANRSVDQAIEVRGESIDELRIPCRWYDEEWSDLYSGYGIQGVRVDADRTGTVCSMCLFALLGAFYHFACAHGGQDLGGVEIVLGTNTRNLPSSAETVLCGSCPIDANEGLEGAVRIGGCPPPIDHIGRALEEIWARSRGRRPGPNRK